MLHKEKEQFVIDEIQGTVARVEAGDKVFEIPLDQLPKGVKEQDLLVKTGENFQIDEVGTQKLKADNASRLGKLKGKSREF